MRRTTIFLLLIISLVISACGLPRSQTQNTKIITSFYPLYEIADKVGGNHVDVHNMVPAGSEPHDYEPTPSDIINLNQARLVIYNGAGMEPWADRIIPDLQKNGIPTLNISELFQNEMIKNNPLAEDEEKNSPYNAHFWLDPVHYENEVKAIAEKLSQLNPEYRMDYQKNAQGFIEQIQELNRAYQNGLQNCKLKNFVTNHAAFAYLAQRYDLEMIPISGVSPDSEPSPQTMARIAQIMKAKNIHTILTESLVSPKIADTLAQETGAKTLILNPLEGLTDKEINEGKSYIQVMKDNLQNLRSALECE